MIESILLDIQSLYDPIRSQILKKFFQSNEWWYGQWDEFLGCKVPPLRKIAIKYKDKISYDQIEILLQNPLHEVRFVALVIMNHKISASTKIKSKKIFVTNEDIKKIIFWIYTKNIKYINNRDLVDISAPNIVWYYFYYKYIDSVDGIYPNIKNILTKFSSSDNLRERRIAIVNTLYFVRKWILEPSIQISVKLLQDKHHLIWKAVGRVLREVGKKDIKLLRDFLSKNHKKMSRTTLGYAIEKMSQEERQKRLKI